MEQVDNQKYNMKYNSKVGNLKIQYEIQLQKEI